jgi:DNA-binding NarL/FixJ family response regulator
MTSGLTRSELRIVRLLLQGYETREIARRADASEKTVNAHISNVLGKLGYRDRAQLIAKVLGYCPEARQLPRRSR